LGGLRCNAKGPTREARGLDELSTIHMVVSSFLLPLGFALGAKLFEFRPLFPGEVGLIFVSQSARM
jgi:hypothetical protein